MEYEDLLEQVHEASEAGNRRIRCVQQRGVRAMDPREDVDLAGMEFPAFRVVKRHEENRGVYSLWDCVCKACGNPCVIQQNRLHIYKRLRMPSRISTA